MTGGRKGSGFQSGLQRTDRDVVALGLLLMTTRTRLLLPFSNKILHLGEHLRILSFLQHQGCLARKLQGSAQIGSDPKKSVPWSGVSLLPHAR